MSDERERGAAQPLLDVAGCLGPLHRANLVTTTMPNTIRDLTNATNALDRLLRAVAGIG